MTYFSEVRMIAPAELVPADDGGHNDSHSAQSGWFGRRCPSPRRLLCDRKCGQPDPARKKRDGTMNVKLADDAYVFTLDKT